MAERTGLEPATSGVTGRRSNQLNYRSVQWARKLGLGTRTGNQNIVFLTCYRPPDLSLPAPAYPAFSSRLLSTISAVGVTGIPSPTPALRSES